MSPAAKTSLEVLREQATEADNEETSALLVAIARTLEIEIIILENRLLSLNGDK